MPKRSWMANPRRLARGQEASPRNRTNLSGQPSEKEGKTPTGKQKVNRGQKKTWPKQTVPGKEDQSPEPDKQRREGTDPMTRPEARGREGTGGTRAPRGMQICTMIKNRIGIGTKSSHKTGDERP